MPKVSFWSDSPEGPFCVGLREGNRYSQYAPEISPSNPVRVANIGLGLWRGGWHDGRLPERSGGLREEDILPLGDSPD